MRTRGAVLALVVLASACTASSSATSPVPTIDGSSVPPTSTAPATTLADGSPLPDGCSGKPTANQTVAFVAGGRAWALDPRHDTLACLFEVTDPGPFAFGPQGDRVLLANMQVQGLGPKEPTWPPKGSTPSVFDWGHPLGLAIVYAGASGQPLKRFMDDGKVERLSTLPAGTYQAIAYHPSGLALGFIVDEGDRQGIWLSDNEGKDPVRLVFSKPDTVFSSLAFSPDGTQIWWIAQHAGAISEIHWMDLADRTGFETILTRGLAPTAHGLLLAPSGPLLATTQGEGCADAQAMIVDADGAHPAIPGSEQPTQALGWLDATTLLVSAGGCDQPMQLFAVGAHGAHATLLVDGVDIGAPRTVLHDAPTEVPSPPNEAPPAPPGGVG
jgi:hypothetical protein